MNLPNRVWPSRFPPNCSPSSRSRPASSACPWSGWSPRSSSTRSSPTTRSALPPPPEPGIHPRSRASRCLPRRPRKEADGSPGRDFRSSRARPVARPRCRNPGGFRPRPFPDRRRMPRIIPEKGRRSPPGLPPGRGPTMRGFRLSHVARGDGPDRRPRLQRPAIVRAGVAAGWSSGRPATVPPVVRLHDGDALLFGLARRPERPGPPRWARRLRRRRNLAPIGSRRDRPPVVLISRRRLPPSSS